MFLEYGCKRVIYNVIVTLDIYAVEGRMSTPLSNVSKVGATRPHKGIKMKKH